VSVTLLALGQACLMTVGLGSAHGIRLRVRDVFAHGAARALPILRLTLHLVVRVLLLAAPFVAAAGGTYWLLLREHDINFYLTDRPPAFLSAVAIVAVIAVLLAALLARKISGWLLALPLVVFERTAPARALGESVRRMQGRRAQAILALALWGAGAIALSFAVTTAVQALGRLAAPHFAGSMTGLIVFVVALALVLIVSSLAVSVIANAFFALILVRVYVDATPDGSQLPSSFSEEVAVGARRLRFSWRTLVGGLIAAVVSASVFTHVLVNDAGVVHPVLVFAHRGSSGAAPENTLAAFRRAGEDGTDFVELDVQESQDGVVVVAHDKDLMKVGRSPLVIWSSTAAQLQAVDIGSFFDPEFQAERMPTLAQALAVCKGVCRVDIELKDYGRSQRLEERVVAEVEAAGMEKDIVTMSLSRRMVDGMKRLRPTWTSGLLAATALGNVARLPVDFLAVETRMSTRDFIRSAHAAHKPVYVWTANDPHRMIRLIGLGVDGLITDYPALAKEVLARYEDMTQAERLLLFVMTQLGAPTDISEPEEELRP
jgi:glycerophosphoryl diester phosphodiesterase